MLAEARKGEIPDNLSFQRADATALPFADDSFDAVIISNALHIIPNPEQGLAEIRRVLRPGGGICFNGEKEQGLKKSNKIVQKTGNGTEIHFSIENSQKLFAS